MPLNREEIEARFNAMNEEQRELYESMMNDVRNAAYKAMSDLTDNVFPDDPENEIIGEVLDEWIKRDF